MWQEWWLVLAAISIILLILLGLLWLVIEFPGLTGWKVVHKESPEGRARQERWRRDSLVIEQREKKTGGKRRGSRVRRVGVDQGVQCLMEVEEEEKRGVEAEEESFDYRLAADQARARSRQTFMDGGGEELVGVHSPVSTDDEDSGVFPNHHHHHSKRKERRGGCIKGECQPPCKGSSVVIVIAGGGQHQLGGGNKDHSVLDSLDLALGPNTAGLRPS